MRIDSHTHIFPKAVRADRKALFKDEPDFAMLYHKPQAKLIGAKEMITAMDRTGVDMSVIFGFPWKKSKNFIRHNDYVRESVAKYPDRFVGFCCMDPFHKNAEKEARRCIDAGLSGVGEIAFYTSGINADAIAALAPLMRITRERHLPVLIHTNEPVGHRYPGKTPVTLSQIESLIRTYHKNRIILAHLGGGILFFRLLKKGMSDLFENVFFDTAAAPFLYDTAVYPLVIALVGAEKILFGSDYPLIRQDRYFNVFKEAGVNKKDLNLICGKNAKQLLNVR